jgi:large subunit ribosomal protein L23
MLKNRVILKRPLLTEKNTRLQDKLNQVAFEVDVDANKIQIQEAVEKKFNVKVQKVRTLHVLGKIKRMGRFAGRRRSWKKAIVTVATGQKIEFFENQ